MVVSFYRMYVLKSPQLWSIEKCRHMNEAARKHLILSKSPPHLIRRLTALLGAERSLVDAFKQFILKNLRFL